MRHSLLVTGIQSAADLYDWHVIHHSRTVWSAAGLIIHDYMDKVVITHYRGLQAKSIRGRGEAIPSNCALPEIQGNVL